ncbi:hypothetical protein [Flammeovirga agarivorans]|uniref:MetA-pathway of phenol degradation n=1 Tax=Flammeovirga agarivorans TaxID=2726742 RepID=A0A7X8XX41_9BACT|nr:hypothetical protein [Flammeovirga agarivorans]NLR92705.1 hypothetical protein [Flammeovirga agarivorans]
MKRIFILVTLLSIISLYQIHAQGCSDAGICSTGALNPSNDKDKSNIIDHKFAITYNGYWQMYKSQFYDQGAGLTVDYKISSKSSVQAKTAYSFKSGPITDTQGMSDVTLSYSYQIISGGKWNLTGVIGGKVPTGKANMTYEGLPLPMIYNTSLGTYDALFGLALTSKAWHISLGIQQPLTTLTEHEYDPYYWRNTEYYQHLLNWFPSSRHLDRKTDISMRLKYAIKTSKWSIAPSVLGIYKPQPGYVESIEDGNYEVIGSEGLTINGLLEASYNINTSLTLSAVGAYAIQQRPLNPDGLQRDYVVNFFIKQQF